MGTLRRSQPLSPNFGWDRGTPVDRYYIESFLAEHRRLVRGRVLEVKDSGYTEAFGTGVTARDVLDIDARNPKATLIADLQHATSIATAEFDCFIMTQTLCYIAQPRLAVAEARRILRPGGALLVTVPALSSRVTDAREALPDYWRFTPDGLGFLLREAFGEPNIAVQGFGNVLAATASLMGMAAEELSRRELDAVDPRFPVLVAARAVKAAV
jgi:SAM-dependent methyltransferase